MKHERKQPNILRITLIAALIVVLVVIGLFYDSGHRLVTREFTITADAIPQSFDGFRIVELSDLHGASFGAGNEKLIKRVRACAPDMIALTGDFFENEPQMETALRLAADLTAIAPVYYVSGNHEWASGAAEDFMAALQEQGVTCLRNDFETITRGDRQILLAGVDDPNSYADLERPDSVIERAQAAHPGLYTILLAHRNDWPGKYPDLPVDLILCGHSHGGIVRIPGVGGLISSDRTLFPQFDAGRYESGPYQMIVSVGLGQSHYFPRLLNNPEIVCVTLRATF